MSSADPSATGYCSTKFALEGLMLLLLRHLLNHQVTQANRFYVGAVECLAKELAIFAPGLKVLLVEPGYFRTRAFSNINHVAPRIDVYSEFNAGEYEEAFLAGPSNTFSASGRNSSSLEHPCIAGC